MAGWPTIKARSPLSHGCSDIGSMACGRAGDPNASVTTRPVVGWAVDVGKILFIVLQMHSRKLTICQQHNVSKADRGHCCGVRIPSQGRRSPRPPPNLRDASAVTRTRRKMKPGWEGSGWPGVRGDGHSWRPHLEVDRMLCLHHRSPRTGPHAGE